MMANYWRHSEMTGLDITSALVMNPSVVAIAISHSATIANNAETIDLPWRQLAAEVANVARPGAAGIMLTLRSCQPPFRC